MSHLISKTCRYKFCKIAFQPKRLNQEYHSGECKKKENNEKARQERQLTKGVDFQIKKNRRILECFFKQNKYIVTLSDLQFNGFDHTKTTDRGIDKNGNYTIPHYMNYSLNQIISNQFKIEQLWK